MKTDYTGMRSRNSGKRSFETVWGKQVTEERTGEKEHCPEGLTGFILRIFGMKQKKNQAILELERRSFSPISSFYWQVKWGPEFIQTGSKFTEKYWVCF